LPARKIVFVGGSHSKGRGRSLKFAEMPSTVTILAEALVGMIVEGGIHDTFG